MSAYLQLSKNGSKKYVSTLPQNLRGLKKTGKEAEIILRIKERRLFAAMFQET